MNIGKIINGCRIENSSSVVLCGDKICCPKLEQLGPDEFKLTDDNGNIVYLTGEQAKLISNGVDVLQGKTLEEQVICG